MVIRSLPGRLAILGSLALFGLFSISAFGQSPVKISGEGTYDFVPGGISTMQLAGTASHFGKYSCFGELELIETPDGSLSGSGIAAFTAANGDHLVGAVELQAAVTGEGTLHISWQDAVTFSNGTQVRSDGRFETSRPPGLRIDVPKCDPCPISSPLCFCPRR